MTLSSSGTPINLGINVLGIDNVPGQQQIAIAAQSSSNTIINVYNCSTRAQVGSTITLSSVNTVAGLCMITATKGMLISSSGVHYGFDLSAGTTNTFGTITNGIFQNFSTSSFQQYASNGSIGLFICNNYMIGKIDPTGPTCTGTVPYWTGTNGDQPCATISKSGTSNFIVSTLRGRIIEIDASFNVVRQYCIKSPNNYPQYGGNVSISTYTQVATHLAYYAGYLLCSTGNGQLILFDHDLGQELQRKSYNIDFGQIANQVPRICNSGSQTVLMTGSSDSNKGTPIVELDFLQTPMRQRGFMYGEGTDGSQTWKFIGINSQSGKIGWAYIVSSGKIWFFPISGERSIASRTISLTLSGVPTPSEAWIFTDVGAGLMQTQLHTTVPAAGRAVPITSGKNALIIVKSAIGANESFISARINPT